MSQVVLETRWLFLLERYVWFILMSYNFKMTYVNNLEKKKLIAYEAATSSPGIFPEKKMGGAGKGPGIGWSGVPSCTLKS